MWFNVRYNIINVRYILLSKNMHIEQNSPGLRPRACQILDIILLVLGSRFSDLGSRLSDLGSRISVLLVLGNDQARHTRDPPGPIPPQTTPVGFRRRRAYAPCHES